MENSMNRNSQKNNVKCDGIKCPLLGKCILNPEKCTVADEVASLVGKDVKDIYSKPSKAGKCPKCGHDLVFIGDYDYEGKVFRKRSVESMTGDVELNVLTSVFNCFNCGYRSRGYGTINSLWEELKK